MFGGILIPMENYRDGVDDANDFESMDFNVLVQNLEVFPEVHLQGDLYFSHISFLRKISLLMDQYIMYLTGAVEGSWHYDARIWFSTKETSWLQGSEDIGDQFGSISLQYTQLEFRL